MATSKNSIRGHKNFIVNGDLTLVLSPDEQIWHLSKMFEEADAQFRTNVSEDGMILRASSTIEYSSEALFTSLMQIGLPVSVAIRIPFQIVDFLRERAHDSDHPVSVSTGDIRVAVVHILDNLTHTGMFPHETVAMWSSAYIRRYGNPAAQLVKVIDSDEERDLNFDYIESTLLPHLLSRILGIPRGQMPLTEFKAIFTGQVVHNMSREIIRSINTLNLYSIRYRTIIHLLQDLILEPPHPWIVNRNTIRRVTEYNMERAADHLQRSTDPRHRENSPLLHQFYHEFFRHSCAAILSSYGAFLGVGERYGLSELQRVLRHRTYNKALWSYCSINSLEADLRDIGSSTDDLEGRLNRISVLLRYPKQDGGHLPALKEHAEDTFKFANHVYGRRVGI